MDNLPRNLLVAFLFTLLASCGAHGTDPIGAGSSAAEAATRPESRSPGSRGAGTSATQPATRAASLPAYVGPAIDAKVEVAANAPTQYTLVATLHAPSGGFEFKHTETVKVDERTQVRFRVVTPGPGEGSIMVLQDLVERVALPVAPGPAVDLVVAVETRGVTAPGTAPWTKAGTVDVPAK